MLLLPITQSSLTLQVCPGKTASGREHPWAGVRPGAQTPGSSRQNLAGAVVLASKTQTGLQGWAAKLSRKDVTFAGGTSILFLNLSTMDGVPETTTAAACQLSHQQRLFPKLKKIALSISSHWSVFQAPGSQMKVGKSTENLHIINSLKPKNPDLYNLKQMFPG